MTDKREDDKTLPVIGRTAYTPCDYGDCDRAPATHKIPLFRVNPKGEPGIFMCAEHARAAARPDRPGPISAPAPVPPLSVQSPDADGAPQPEKDKQR